MKPSKEQEAACNEQRKTPPKTYAQLVCGTSGVVGLDLRSLVIFKYSKSPVTPNMIAGKATGAVRRLLKREIPGEFRIGSLTF